MENLNLPVKSRLAALHELQESAGWIEFGKELATRHTKALTGAVDLSQKRKQRDAAAGVATELEQLIRHVPTLISDLTKKLEQEKKRASPKAPV